MRLKSRLFQTERETPFAPSLRVRSADEVLQRHFAFAPCLRRLNAENSLLRLRRLCLKPILAGT